MKKYIIGIAISIVGIKASIACSWYSEDASYYNLFNQELIADKSLSPFYLTYDVTFYGDSYEYDNESKDEINYNILEWKKYFDNHINEKDLNYLVYQSSLNELTNIANTKSFNKVNDILKKQVYMTDKGMEAIQYLIFAKKCEPFATMTRENGDDEWSYSIVRKTATKAQFMSIAKIGNGLYATTKNNDIKLRIAYQLVRLSHYAGFNDDAVRYFNTYVEPLKQKSLFYYYALEQKGGALFNQKKYAEAGAAFASVFNNTTDRKIPCYASFRISNQMDFNKSIAYCKTANEKAALYVLRGFNKFSNGLSEMKNIYAVAPKSAYLELMACRALMQLEHKAFLVPNDYEYIRNSTFPTLDANSKVFLQKIILFTETLLKEKKASRTDFWQAYLAHLYLLNGDYQKAKNTADKVISDDKDIIAQSNRTSFCAYIANLKTIDATAEQKINERYLSKISNENEKNFVYEILAHNYIMQNNFAKAFLCHNDFTGLYGSLNINIITDLIALFEKENKSEFEQSLINNKIKSKEPLLELYDLKGTHYFKNDDLKNALVWYKKINKNIAFLKIHEYQYDDEGKESVIEKDGDFNGYSNIDAGIFSNKVQTYFDDDIDNAFNDKTYQSFAFIENKMNKRQLVEALIQLKKTAIGNDENAAKANFLLGNFYYNTSLWGFYRNFFYYEPGNYYLSYVYTYNTIPNKLKESYNYNAGAGLISYNQPKKPYDYFLKAESLSSDKEMKAKAVFQASKCELDLLFSAEDYNFYSNLKQLYNSTNRPMFKRLKTYYAQTAYFKEIQSNCSYFKYYLQYRL